MRAFTATTLFMIGLTACAADRATPATAPMQDGSDGTDGSVADARAPATHDAASVTSDASLVLPDEPEPFEPGACTLQQLEAHAQCADATGCPIELAGDVDCAGMGGTPSLAFDGQRLYAALLVSEALAQPSSLVALRIEPEAGALDVHAVEGVERGFVRLDGDAPVLFTSSGGQNRALRGDASFASFGAEPIDFAGTLLDAYFETGGTRHVWTSTDAGIERDGAAVLTGARPLAMAVSIAPDDREAAAFVSLPQASLRLWTADGVERELAPAPMQGAGRPPRVALAPYAPSPTGWLASADLDGRVFAYGAGLDGAPLLGQLDTSVRACMGRMTVSAPDVCPSETTTLPLGEQVLSHGVVADDDSGAWLVALVGSTTVTCGWYNSGSGCFESLPCDCMQSGRAEHADHALVVQRVAEAAETFRFELSDVPAGALAYTQLIEGRLFVALTYPKVIARKPHVGLRYFALRLP